MEIRLPPNYVNCPAAIVYEAGLSAGALRTFLRIYGLHWDKRNPPRLTRKGWTNALQLGKSTFYEHLKELEESGWLSSSTDGEDVLAFDFQKRSASQEDRPGNGNEATLLIPDSILLNKDPGEAAVRNPGKRKKHDERLDHPAVKLYRQVMRLTASEGQRQTIIDTVKDIDLWRESLEHWAAHGWRPTSLPGMLDSYQRGGRAACASCRRIGERGSKAAGEEGNRGDREQPTVEELRAMIAAGKAQRDAGKAQRDAGKAQRDAGKATTDDR